MASNDTKSFASLWGRDDLADVTLHLKGSSLKVHKVVLAAGSEYFHKMFFGAFAESDMKEVELKEDDTIATKRMILWLYGTQHVLEAILTAMSQGSLFDWEKRELIRLHLVADKYCVHDLCTRVLQELFARVNTSQEKFVQFTQVVFDPREQHPDSFSKAAESHIMITLGNGLLLSEMLRDKLFCNALSNYQNLTESLLYHHPTALQRYEELGLSVPKGIKKTLIEVNGLASKTLETLVAVKHSDSKPPRDRLASLVTFPGFQKLVNEDVELAIAMLKRPYVV